MLPTRLNLLSPKKQRHLRRMIFFQFAKELLEMALLILSIVGIALVGGRWVLETHLDAVKQNVQSISSQQHDVNMKITAVNRTLRELGAIQSAFTPWSGRVGELANALPPRVMLTSLTMSASGASATISGEAETRDGLLALKKNLESIEWIDNIDIPLSQLTQKDHVTFQLVIPTKHD